MIILIKYVNFFNNSMNKKKLIIYLILIQMIII